MISQGYIYCVRNTVNNKHYIGQTIRMPHLRMRAHINSAFRNGDNHFYRSIRKYGVAAFEIEWMLSVDIFPIDSAHPYIRTSLDAMEIAAISLFETFTDKSKGYNERCGGDGGKLSLEARRKIGDANRRRGHRSEETRLRISKTISKTNRSRGPVSEETRRKIGDATRARGPQSIETRRKISEAAKGRSPSALTRRKISEACGKPVRCIELDMTFSGACEAARQLRMMGYKARNDCIGKCAIGQIETHLGLHWKWVNQRGIDMTDHKKYSTENI